MSQPLQRRHIEALADLQGHAAQNDQARQPEQGAREADTLTLGAVK